MFGLRGDDLDDVPVLEAIVERDKPVVHLRANGPMADIGMDAIGEVKRRGARRKVLDLALGREHKDLILEDVELDSLDELRGIADVPLPVHELAEPGELGVVFAIGLRPLLVPPVRGDPDFGNLVHRLRPDLDLERLSVQRDHGGVKRLVEVVLGNRDVVVELARDRAPQRMDDAEGGVAVPQILDQDADRIDIVDLAELGALALHLLPDAVDVLRATLEIDRDPGLPESGLQFGDRPLDVAFAALASRVEELGQLPEALRFEDLEGEVLEFPLDLPDSQALGQRGVDLERLLCNPGLLVRRERGQRPHVVEPVGELDEDDPDVLGHRQEHLSDVLGLLLFVAQRAELAELRHPVDEVRNLLPEPLLDIGELVFGVLGDVVQDGGFDGLGIHAEFSEDLRRRDRVGHVGLAGRPCLAAVRLDGHRDGPLDAREVSLRVMGSRRREEARGLCLDRGRGGPGLCARQGPRRRAARADRPVILGRRVGGSSWGDHRSRSLPRAQERKPSSPSARSASERSFQASW